MHKAYINFLFFTCFLLNLFFNAQAFGQENFSGYSVEELDSLCEVYLITAKADQFFSSC